MTNRIYTVGHSTRGFDEVVDIMSTTTVKPAVLHKHARVQDGRLTYPPQA